RLASQGNRRFRQSRGRVGSQPFRRHSRVDNQRGTGTSTRRGNSMRLNGYLARSTVVAALGGLLFGFDTAVISGTTAALTEHYQLTPQLLGITVASAIWGTIIGAMAAGYPGERLGRRDSLRIMSVLSADWAWAARRFWVPCTSLRSLQRSGVADWSDCFSSTWCSASFSPISLTTV